MRQIAIAFLVLISAPAQQRPPEPVSEAERPLLEGIRSLRKLSDTERAKVTLSLALKIRELPDSSVNRLTFAASLANLSTEGDFGRKVLEEVANTLALALSRKPIPLGTKQEPASPYRMLAQLARYEGIAVTLNDPAYSAAMAQLEAADLARAAADFTLTDLAGKSWHLHDLKGQVVLVNFWATWCPPCRKEMPDLDALYRRFAKKGFVILALSDEDDGKVKAFIREEGYRYPILLDPGGLVAKRFQVDGIPKSFLFDRAGKLVAQSIDMRTRHQFEVMLAKAGL